MINQPRQIGDYVTAVDPMREQLSASYAVVPGGPQNNSPMNALSVNNGSPNTYPSAYGDIAFQNVPQLMSVMPQPVSQLPQQMVMGQGFNQQTPMIQQPPAQMSDQLESNRLGGEAQMRGLVPSAMGAIGLEAQPAPGGSVPSPQQAPNTMPLNTPSPEMMAQQNSMMNTMNRGARNPGGMRT